MIEPVPYPKDLPVPDGLRSAHLALRMLRADDVDLDLEAVEASRPHLLRRSAGRWPRPGFHWRDNLADLVVHQIEHLQRLAFTYTVMTPTGDRCLGCLYLRPMGEHLGSLGVAPTSIPTDSRISTARYWLRPDALALGLDRHLLALLRPWFREAWGFSEVLLMLNRAEVRLRRLAQEEGLEVADVVVGGDGRRWWLFRL